MFFPSPWPSSPSFGWLHGYKSKWIQGPIAYLVISLSKQSVWPCLLPVILPAMKISLCWCLSMSHKGLQCCSHLFLGSDSITCTAISKPGPSLFFLTQLIGNMSQCYKCMFVANGMITGVENRKKKHLNSLCPQDLLRSDHIYTIAIWQEIVGIHILLYDLVDQITSSSWWVAQVAW